MVPKLTRKSRVKFHKLFDRLEEGEYIIGREDTEEFIGVPKEGQDILKLLKEGKTIGQAEDALKKEFGDLDVLDFTKTLESEGFIKSIDGQVIKDKHKKVHHILNWVDKKHVSWLFSAPMYFIYGILIITGFIVMNRFTHYLPTYEDFFFHDSLTVIYLLSFMFSWFLVFGHELSHFFGARSLGIPATFSISNRLYFLVAETDMSDIWEVEPRKRYRAYIAGMLFDLVVLSLAVLIMYAHDLGIIPLAYSVFRILKWVVLVQLLGVAWQFLFFMETDIYYVVGNYFRTSDLMCETKIFLGNIVRKVLGRRQHPLDIEAGELKVVKIYSGFWFFSTFVTLFRFLLFQLPISIMLIVKTFTKLGSAGTGLVDGVLFVILSVLDYGLLLYAMHKKHKQQGKRFHIGHFLHHLFHMHSRHKHR